MKHPILITLLFFVSFSGCEKEYVPIHEPGNMTFGRADAKKNGKKWTASAAAYIYPHNPAYFGIAASTVSEEGFPREHIAFNKIPLEAGIYHISGTTNNVFDGNVGASYSTQEDDGAGEDDYILDEEADDNQIEVIVVDTVADVAQGYFTVSFVIDPVSEKRNPKNPDRVKFSKGVFNVRFSNKNGFNS